MTSETPTNIQITTIEDEMRSSFIDYAMSVIVSRALPNVRDGLKPVHRRILYAMHVLRNYHNQAYKKSARVVGDVIGKYHPHGDTAVYDALVRMAQHFSLRYPLADGQGNFGSIDGDPAAAMRYTEVRMDRIGGEMLTDIDMETVDWQPNYDEKEMEPVVLPARIPNLLINGTQGIAVGMATNIPPHNLTEIVNATIALIHNPKITVSELIKMIPGPDFPTAGFIYGRSGIQRAYHTGRGQIVMRGRTHTEQVGRSKKDAIIITELPYQVNKARLVEKIAGLVKEKRLGGISDLRDESDRQGMRVVIELRKDAMHEVVLNQLYKLTQLQDTFGVNMLAIVDGRPEVLPIKTMLEKFIEHRQDVVTRRSIYQLKEAEKRAHILEGLKTALDNIDAIIVLIRKAATPAVAKEELISQFSLSPIQAQAILDMRLQRLTGLERDKILAELKDVRETIAFLQDILANVEKLMAVVVEELEDIRTRYGDERRTEIVDASGEINMEDLIADEMNAVAVTHSGYIKRNSIDTYRAQKRGGKGVTGMATRGEDFLRELFIANTHDFILMFTNSGRVYCKRVYEIPQGSRTSRGKAIVNLLDLRQGERVQQMLSVKTIEEGYFVVMATRNGVVKKTKLEDFSNIRTTGIIAIDLEDGDALSEVRLTDGSKQIFLSTRQGMSIRFDEDQIRAMGRNARGVRGIALRENDAMVGMAVLDTDSTASVVTVCEKGYGKRSSAEEFSSQKRGGLGVIAIKTTDRNGLVVGSRVVGNDDDIMMITASGTVIRMTVEDIRVIGRNTQGVRLIRLDEGERVVSVERLAEPADVPDPEDETATPDAIEDTMPEEADEFAEDAGDGEEVESE